MAERDTFIERILNYFLSRYDTSSAGFADKLIELYEKDQKTYNSFIAILDNTVQTHSKSTTHLAMIKILKTGRPKKLSLSAKQKTDIS